MSSSAPLARTRRPRRGQNRQSAPRMELFKIPVNVPPDVAQFRAEYSGYARWLPPHLANIFIGAICTADAHGEDAVTTYEAISAATHTPGLQRRYKCKPVSPMQVERNMPRLQELGVLTWHSEKTRVTGWSDHYGEIRARIYLRLTISNIERLYELAEKARHDKGVRDADRTARRAAYEQDRNETRKAERARNTPVTCEDAEGINSCPTPNAGSSAGTDAGSSAGRIVPDLSFVLNPTYPSSRPGDDGDDSFSPVQDQGQDRRGQAPRTPQDGDEPWDQAREWLAGHLAVNPAQIGWNAVHLADDLALEHGVDVVAAAAQHSRERGRDPVAHFVVSAQAQCVRVAAEQQRREEEAQRAAEQRRMDEAEDVFSRRFAKLGVTGYRNRMSRLLDESSSAEEFVSQMEPWLADETAKAERQREQAARDREQRTIESRIEEFAYRAMRAREEADAERAAEVEFNERLSRYAELHGLTLDAAREASAEWGPNYVCRLRFVSSAITIKEMDAERDKNKAAFLDYVREHATQEEPVLVTTVADAIGVNFAVAVGMASLLRADGLIVQKNYKCHPTQAA